MACNELTTDCSPKNGEGGCGCADCGNAVAHTCRCGDIALPDGRFVNATVIVEGGCIRAVENGMAPLYTPDVCCAGTGSGSGGGMEGPEGPKGDPGENATISIGSVNTVSPDQKARVENVGTETNAVLNFYIPSGKPGNDASNVTGVTNTTGSFAIENGLIKALPAGWPPVTYITASGTPSGVLVTTEKDNSTGTVSLKVDLSSYDSTVRRELTEERQAGDQALQTQITALQSQVTSLQSQITGLQNRVTSLENRL